MKTLIAVALVAILLTAACESGSPSRNPSGSSGNQDARPGSNLKPSDIKPVTQPTTVSWLALKTAVGRRGNPKDSLSEMHLINKAHPDSKKAISLNSFKKVLSNDQMGLLLALLAERKFDRLATPGLEPARIPKGSANGAIVVRSGGRVKTLVFKKGAGATASDVPLAYRQCREIIIGVWNKADQYQVYAPEERVLGIERLK